MRRMSVSWQNRTRGKLRHMKQCGKRRKSIMPSRWCNCHQLSRYGDSDQSAFNTFTQTKEWRLTTSTRQFYLTYMYC